MPLLAVLRFDDFSIWPFNDAGAHTSLESYPSLLSGPVNKSDPGARHRHLVGMGPGEPLLETAASSDDAFDAAVSALSMARYSASFAGLRAVADRITRREGGVWQPGV